MSLSIKKKSKAALQKKTRAAKKHLEHKVSLTAMAAAAPDDLLAAMKLERRSLSSLKGLRKRVRKSEKDQVERVARSIKTVKQVAPILIDQSGKIINGHVVVRALKLLGATEVWCAVIEHLDEDERSPYRSAHEFIVIFCKGKKLAVNNIELGKHERDRTNVWSYPGANRKGSSASKALAKHPTPKSITMVRDALLDVSHRGGIVLDPFMGSGTTIIAAEQCGWVARGIELDPAYVDVAVRRWQELTGEAAVHAQTGLSFAEMAKQRALEIGKADAALIAGMTVGRKP